MSFVQVGGDAHSKPTYFELLAADSLVPSLKSAVVYTLSVLSQRYPRLHRLLRYEDELLALLLLLVDWHSLSACDATFAEGLYGLRRSSRRPLSRVKAAGTSAATGDGERQRLTAMQRHMGLLLQVRMWPLSHSPPLPVMVSSQLVSQETGSSSMGTHSS